MYLYIGTQGTDSTSELSKPLMSSLKHPSILQSFQVGIFLSIWPFRPLKAFNYSRRLAGNKLRRSIKHSGRADGVFWVLCGINSLFFGTRRRFSLKIMSTVGVSVIAIVCVLNFLRPRFSRGERLSFTELVIIVCQVISHVGLLCWKLLVDSLRQDD